MVPNSPSDAETPSGASVERVRVPYDGVPNGASNAYLVGGVLLDPGARCAALDRLVHRRDVDHVAVTHTHPDHVGAVARYARETGALVHAHAPHAERFERVTGVAPDRTYREGDRIGPLDVLYTPGHAPDGVTFAAGGRAFVGDLLRADGSVAVGADGDLRAYLASLRRLYARGFAVLHPGHGDFIGAPRERIDAVVAHRRERERRVLDAVRDGVRSPDDVVDAAYDADLGEYRDLAVETVRAHLDKLAVEGRVVWNGKRAAPA